MAVAEVLKAAEVQAAEASQGAKKEVEGKKPGDAARKTLRDAAAAKAATVETETPSVVEVKPAEKAPEKKVEATPAEKSEAEKLHEAKTVDFYKSQVEDLKKQLSEKKQPDPEVKKPDPEKKVEGAKFEMPKVEIPDFTKFGDDEDLTPHYNKAFNSLKDAFETTVAKLMEKIEELGGDVSEIGEYAQKLSDSRKTKIGNATNKAIEGAVAKIKEEFGLEALPEMVSRDFVKMYQAGLVEIDLLEDLPDVADVMKAWKLANMDIVEKHTAKAAEKAPEKKPEEKKKPVISGASAGAGGGSELKGSARVRATLLAHNPERFAGQG